MLMYILLFSVDLMGLMLICVLFGQLNGCVFYVYDLLLVCCGCYSIVWLCMLLSQFVISVVCVCVYVQVDVVGCGVNSVVNLCVLVRNVCL